MSFAFLLHKCNIQVREADKLNAIIGLILTKPENSFRQVYEKRGARKQEKVKNQLTYIFYYRKVSGLELKSNSGREMLYRFLLLTCFLVSCPT